MLAILLFFSALTFCQKPTPIVAVGDSLPAEDAGMKWSVRHSPSSPVPAAGNPLIPSRLRLMILTFPKAGGGDSEAAPWPLFEFWNPLTWISPKFSSETMLQILRGGKDSHKKLHQQLKKALLPGDLFLGNIRAQRAAWDGERKKSSGRRPPSSKNKADSNKQRE